MTARRLNPDPDPNFSAATAAEPSADDGRRRMTLHSDRKNPVTAHDPLPPISPCASAAPDPHPDNHGGPIVAHTEIQGVDFLELLAANWDAPSSGVGVAGEPKPDVCLDEILAEEDAT